MSMSTTEAIEALAAQEEVSLVKPEVTALEAITRSEVAMQLDSAHRWPRSISRFLQEARSLATISVEVAESCMYSVPRGGKMITGPSVRLAEMVASSWGNLHVGARVIDATETEVIAQAVAWDLQKNTRVTIEAQRSILDRNGRRFNDDMIRVTGMAAISIALRNAVFRIVPRAYVDTVYAHARAVAVGDAKTLVSRRDDVLGRLGKLGATPDRVLARLGVAGINDISLEHLETLIGLGTAIKGGDLPLDEAFPMPAPAAIPEGTPEGKRVIKVGKGKAAPAAAVAAQTEKPAESKPPEPQPAAQAQPEPKRGDWVSPEDDGRIT